MQRHEIAPRRKALNWSQKTLGIAIGIGESTAKQQINRIEVTDYAVSPERLSALDAALTKEEDERKLFAAFKAGLAAKSSV